MARKHLRSLLNFLIHFVQHILDAIFEILNLGAKVRMFYKRQYLKCCHCCVPAAKQHFGLILSSQGAKLPTIEDDVLLLSASQLAVGIRNRELSAEAVMRSFIRRIKDVNPHLNCFVAGR